MAPETYYYFFSIIFVLVTAFFIGNLVYLRFKGKTLFGLSFKVGTPEYKRGVTLGSNRNITISTVIELAFIANLANSVSDILRLRTPDAHFVLIFAPVFILVLAIIISFKSRDMLNKITNRN